MSDEIKEKNPTCPGNRKHRLGRRTRLTVAVVTLVGVGAVLGAGATAQAARMGGWHGMGHERGHANTKEQVRERALDKTAWVLGRIDATPELKTRVNAIVTSLVGDLYPLRGEHQETTTCRSPSIPASCWRGCGQFCAGVRRLVRGHRAYGASAVSRSTATRVACRGKAVGVASR